MHNKNWIFQYNTHTWTVLPINRLNLGTVTVIVLSLSCSVHNYKWFYNDYVCFSVSIINAYHSFLLSNTPQTPQITFVIVPVPISILHLFPVTCYLFPVSRSELSSWHIKLSVCRFHILYINMHAYLCLHTCTHTQIHTHTLTLAVCSMKSNSSVYTFILYLSIINYLEKQSEVNAL